MTRLRWLLSCTLYAVGGCALLVALLSAFRGGFALDLGDATVSVRSWKALRPVALVIALALAVDPGRSHRLAIATAWLNRHHKTLSRAALVYALLFLCAYKLCQHLSLHTGAYDLAMFSHALQNTLEGAFLHAFGLDRNFLSEHFSPVLLLVLVPYAAVPRPETLLVVEAMAVVAACVPLYRVCSQLNLDRACSTLLVVMYMTNEVIWRGFAFDFHMELFAPLALFGLADAALRDRRWAAVAWLTFALSIKEDMALAAAALLSALLIRHGARWRFLGGMIVVCGMWLAGALGWAIPLAHPDGGSSSHFLTRWGHLGGTYGEVAWSLFTEPGYWLGLTVSEPMRDVVRSLGVLPLVDPVSFVLALPLFLLHLSSGFDYQASLGVYYAVPGVCVLIIGCAWATVRIRRVLGLAVARTLLLLIVLADPHGKWCDPVSRSDIASIRLASSIPHGDSVAAQTCLVPHIAPSRAVRLLRGPSPGTEWVIVHATKSHWPMSDSEFTSVLAAIESGSNFAVVEAAGPCRLYRRITSQPDPETE